MKKLYRLLRWLVYSSDLLFYIYYKFIFRPKDDLQKFLDNFSRAKKGKVKFIQIGANDGMWNDPIYKFIRRDRWIGILIEPQKDIFHRLKYNYRKLKNNLVFENIAIDNASGEKKIYKISFTNARWASGISSFVKEDVQKMIDAGYVERMARQDNLVLPKIKNEWISEEYVKTTTLYDLVKKHNFFDIDLIMIDTEGYDYEIIKSIPFNIIFPKTIIYEHTHLSNDIKEECKKYLNAKGYSIIECQSDTIAIR